MLASFFMPHYVMRLYSRPLLYDTTMLDLTYMGGIG